MSSDNTKSIVVSLTRQRLTLKDGAAVIAEYPVSTSAFGPGELEGSQCTPRGAHVVDELIGDGEPEGAVFVGRVPTGEVWSAQLAADEPERDWVLSRVIWLAGTEQGQNAGERDGTSCDTRSRYIYIHGTAPDAPLGVPYSHGCVRMNPADVISLYDQLDTGIPVLIEP